MRALRDPRFWYGVVFAYVLLSVWPQLSARTMFMKKAG